MVLIYAAYSSSTMFYTHPANSFIRLKSSDEIILTSETDTVTVQLEIITDSEGGQGERTVQLQLQYSGPAHFSNFVMIGVGASNNPLSVTVVDDDREYNKRAQM